MVAEVGGVRQYVQMLQKGMVGVDAKSGKLLWRYDKTTQGSPAVIPTPVIHEDMIYSAAARAASLSWSFLRSDKPRRPTNSGARRPTNSGPFL